MDDEKYPASWQGEHFPGGQRLGAQYARGAEWRYQRSVKFAREDKGCAEVAAEGHGAKGCRCIQGETWGKARQRQALDRSGQPMPLAGGL
jgi:hypothetical protein